jgi:hypothetical protein
MKTGIVSYVATRPIVWVVRFYQVAVSPYLPRTCRYLPTCSEYALQAMERYGLCKGMYLTIRRILRCHPWGKGGYDPLA